jgi:uncharacterized MnhB-related membrane protein
LFITLRDVAVTARDAADVAAAHQAAVGARLVVVVFLVFRVFRLVIDPTLNTT